MEIDVYARLVFFSDEALKLAHGVLEGSPSAPLFEEEVAPPLKATFATMETLAAPQSVTVLEGERALLLHWFFGRGADAEECLEELSGAAVKSLTALFLGDDGSVDGRRLTSSGFERVRKVGGKRLTGRGHPLTVLEKMASEG